MPTPFGIDPLVLDFAVSWLAHEAPGAPPRSALRAAHDARVQSLATAVQHAVEDWHQDEAAQHAERDDRDDPNAR